jgi:hypothetical protein
MQSVPITTKVVSFNPADDEVYSIQHYVIKFWLELWGLTPLSAIFQLYRGGQFLLVEENGVPGENH